MLKRGICPDSLTDQTSAHDPANGYCPAGWSVAKWQEMRERDPAAVAAAARESIARHVEAMLAYKEMGVPTFDYGNNIRQEAKDMGVTHAFDFPGFVPAYVRPLFCRGIGPFRWVALSGDPEDIYRTDAKVKELIPDDPHLHRWLDMARERIAFQACPRDLLGRPGAAPPSAERVAKPTDALVIAVWQRGVVSLPIEAGVEYILEDIPIVLAKANQALGTLNKYRARLDQVSTRLTALEFEAAAPCTTC